MKKILNIIPRQDGVVSVKAILIMLTLGILTAAVVFYLFNRQSEYREIYQSKRREDVWTLVDAVYKYSIDHTGYIQENIPTTEIEICMLSGSDCEGYLDLSVLTLDDKYLSSIPKDPDIETGSGSGYTIQRTTNDRVTVRAPLSGKENIEITK